MTETTNSFSALDSILPPVGANTSTDQPDQPATENKFAVLDDILPPVGSDGNVRQLKNTLDIVSRTNPDDAAEMQRLSAASGLPFDVVQRNVAQVKRQMQINDDVTRVSRLSPMLKQQLQDPFFAAIAHDDIDNLSQTEHLIKSWNGPKPSIGSIASGLFDNLGFSDRPDSVLLEEHGLLDTLGFSDRTDKISLLAYQNLLSSPASSALKLAVHDIFASDDSVESQVYRQDLQRKALQAQARIDSSTLDFQNSTAGAIYSGGASFMQALPGLALSIATGNPVPSLALAGVNQGAPAYPKYLDRGASKAEAALGALGEGATEIGFEALPMGYVINKFGKAGAGEFLTGLAARELPTEQATTLVQDAIDTAIANPDKTWGDYWAERPEAAYQTLVATLTQGGVMGGIHAAARRLSEDAQQAETAQQVTGFFERLNQLATVSKVNTRNPGAMKSFVDTLIKDTGAENVYIDAHSFAQSGIAEKVSAILPEVAAQLPEALATGGEVRIPVSDYFTQIAGTDLAPPLLEHVRVEGQEASLFETNQFKSGPAGERLAQDFEHAMTQQQADESFQASTLAVKDIIKQQLDSTDRYTSKANEKMAIFASSRYAVLADALGKTPEEMFQQYPMNIAAMGSGGQSVFNQAEKTATDVTGRWQKALRNRTPATRDKPLYFDTPTVLKQFGVKEKITPVPSRVLMQILSKHPDVPKSVFANLPTLLADPTYIFPHKDGGVSVAIDAQTEKGEPIIVGVRDGRVRTITPLHHSEKMTGTERLLAAFQNSTGSGYARNEKALAEAKAFNPVAGWDNSKGHNVRSRKSIVTRDDLVKQFGENFYQGGLPVYNQRSGAKRDDYTVDLFGIPDETEGGLSRDDVPDGTYATRTQIVQENTRQLGTDQVNSPEQAAQALAYLSKSTVERFDALVTDKDGKPLAIVGSFKGAVDGGSVYTATITGEAFRIEGAANIWFAHNHPSGIAEFSDVDRAIYNKLENVFRGSEITPRGMLAIGGQQNEGRKWVFNDNPDVKEGSHSDVKGVTAKAKGRPKTTPVVERVYSEEGKLADAINSPTTAKSAAESLSNGESGVMLLDNQQSPVAFIPVKSTESETLRTDGRMDALHRGLSMANAAAAIIVNQGDMTNNAVMNLSGFFNSNEVRVLDVLDKNGDGMDSRAQAGLSFSRNTFNQGEDQRGAFNPLTRTITLMDKADLSTFLHEAGHFFLEMQFDLMANLRKEDDLIGTSSAQKQLIADTEALLKWFGLESLEQWHALDFEQKRVHHEKFAEAFEKYLFEGVAPSQALQHIFASFRQWMMKVYEQLKDHFKDIELTDEVRSVFDRMLATDAEIKYAQESRSMMPLFADQEKSGMTPEEWADYQAAGKDSTSTAMEQLALKGVRDMQWLQNARNRKLKELQRQHKELRREVRAEVEKEVLAHPIYQAWDFLTRKEGGGKLDAEAVREMDLPVMVTQRLRDFSMIRVEDGLHPDLVAEMFGFSSGDHLVRELAAAEKSKDLIKQLTDQRMLQNYGELSTPEAIQRAADAAIHNEVRARFVTTEANALAKATGSLRILGNAAKEMAKTMISRLKIRDVQPMQYSRAEIRAAKVAAKASQHGDIKQAATEKRNQVLNLHLRKAAYEVEDEVEAGIKRFKRLQSATAQSNMRGKMLAQLNALEARFDFRTSLSLKAIDENKVPLAEWIVKESEELSAVVPELPDFMLDENYRKHYKDLTVEQFRGLMDGIKQLEFLARREQKQYLEIRKQSFDQERDAVLQVLQKNYPDAFDEEGIPRGLQPEFVPTLSKALSDLGNKTIGEFINAENIIDLLERGQMGPVFESLFSRLTHQSDWKAERLSAIYQDLKPLFKAYTFKEGRDFSRKGIFVKEIDTSITRENAVMVALLNGNAEGQHRLTNYGWGPHHINAITAHLTDKDIDLVEGIWKLFDYSLWPELQALNERTRGKSPPKVEAVPYVINGRPVTGGYMRLKYDTDLDERAHRMDEGQAVTELLGGGLGMSSKTNQGTSTQRLQGVKLRPRLDLGVFSETIAESVHDLAYREAIADTMRMLNDRGIQSAIKSAQGVPAYRALVTRVREVAAPPRNPSGFIEKSLSVARKNTVVTMMSGVKTALQNFTGLFPAMAKVSPALLMREVATFYSPQMIERTRFAMEQSAYMRGRFDHFDRDLQDMARQLTGISCPAMPCF